MTDLLSYITQAPMFARFSSGVSEFHFTSEKTGIMGQSDSGIEYGRSM